MKFDYVIIGAGSAGCVLSNRLSEDQNNKVAVFEAGGSSDTWKVISQKLAQNCQQFEVAFLTRKPPPKESS